MTDKLTTLSTDLLKIIQSVRRSGMPGPDGLSTTGSECPAQCQISLKKHQVVQKNY